MPTLRIKPVRSETAPFKVTDTHLRLPNLTLSNCVRAYVSRNTAQVALAADEMLNHYPASPLCTFMFTIKGEGELISVGDERIDQKVNERAVVSGPHTLPSVTRNLTEIHGFMVFFMPDALQALTGIDIPSLVNNFRPIAEIFDRDWQRLGDAILAAPDDESRIEILETFLLPRWKACRARGLPESPRYQDWIVGFATRAALSNAGRSTRQLERRVKQWSGQSLQRLRGFARAETSFFTMREANEQDLLNWAEVAFNTGFSDQAHLCREVRRITGFSPEEIKRGIETAESFWIYRLWI